MLAERYDYIAYQIEHCGSAIFFEALTSANYGETAARAAAYGVSHQVATAYGLRDRTLAELQTAFLSTVSAQAYDTRYCEYARATIVDGTLLIIFFTVPVQVAA